MRSFRFAEKFQSNLVVKVKTEQKEEHEANIREASALTSLKESQNGIYSRQNISKCSNSIKVR